MKVLNHGTGTSFSLQVDDGSSVCVCLCVNVCAALFIKLYPFCFFCWPPHTFTPNHFLISGPSAAQLAATHTSKGWFHITWQRALPWHHFWPLAERANVLPCALHYNLGQLWMWQWLSSPLYCPTKYPKNWSHVFCLFCLSQSRSVHQDTILLSPNVVLLLTAIFIPQHPQTRFKGNTAFIVGFHLLLFLLSSFHLPFP